jgi:hypothetical protein
MFLRLGVTYCQLAIMLSRIKMDYPQIRKSIVEVDDERLSIDDLKALNKQLPTSEEVCHEFLRIRTCLKTILD